MSTARDQTLPREYRISKRSEFRRIQNKGRRHHTQHFIVLSSPNDKNHCRLGITVTKKIGNAVIRNRIKRLVREVFRHHQHQLPPNTDFVFIAKKMDPMPEYALLDSEITALLKKMRTGADN